MAERLGWHVRGYIPHFDGYGAAQHIVFRTLNSLHRDVISGAEKMSVTQARHWIDTQLDLSKEGRVFSDIRAAMMMEEIIRHFDGERFDLLAWCIMPNHLHVFIVPLGHYHLGSIVRTWKVQASKWLGGGQIFASDYFDRYIRDTKHMATTLAYIENNPVKAGLCLEPHQWEWSSASKRAKGWIPNTKNCPLFLS